VEKSIAANKAHFFTINAPFKVCNCEVPADHFYSEISSRALVTIQNIRKTRKQGNLFELNMYFVRILIKFYAYSNNSHSL